MFVGLKKKGKDTRRFRYLGRYHAVRVQPLTQEEWASLPEDVRNVVYHEASAVTDRNSPYAGPEDIRKDD